MLRQLGRRLAAQPRAAVAAAALPALSATLPRLYSKVAEGLHYAKSHEWVKVEGGVATVGISDHAQAELGDVVYVELPAVGATVKAGETFGVVESVKAASDVYSPVSGEVVEVNTTLTETPALINTAPFSDAWIMKVKPSAQAADMAKLLDAAAYTKLTEEAH